MALFRLSSGSSTGGRVARAPGLPIITFTFSFLLKWSCGSQGWNSFLEGDVVFSSTVTFQLGLFTLKSTCKLYIVKHIITFVKTLREGRPEKVKLI